jgi:endonuclease/exonuclease/phosphatase family metal-dependent hydrolase
MNPTDFNVLTLNIHKGFSTTQRRFTLENIRNCLRDSKATVVFLQEVVGEHTRFARKIPGWPKGNQLEFLADSVWSHHAYGKNAIYQHGHHGNAILSEMPFKSWHNLDISLFNYSQRGILHGITANDLHLVCVHFGLFESERRAQANKLVEYVRNHIPDDAPLILAGDFNDWRKSIHIRMTRELHLTDAHQQLNNRVARTFPSIRPLLPMDRIYLRGFQVRSCDIMSSPEWRHISDHCAMIARLSLHK